MTSICAGVLSDRRLQVFAIDTHGNVFSYWKTTTEPNASWTPWSAF